MTDILDYQRVSLMSSALPEGHQFVCSTLDHLAENFHRHWDNLSVSNWKDYLVSTLSPGLPAPFAFYPDPDISAPGFRDVCIVRYAMVFRDGDVWMLRRVYADDMVED